MNTFQVGDTVEYTHNSWDLGILLSSVKSIETVSEVLGDDQVLIGRGEGFYVWSGNCELIRRIGEQK